LSCEVVSPVSVGERLSTNKSSPVKAAQKDVAGITTSRQLHSSHNNLFCSMKSLT
jgi:hypothetical protein